MWHGNECLPKVGTNNSVSASKEMSVQKRRWNTSSCQGFASVMLHLAIPSHIWTMAHLVNYILSSTSDNE